MSEPRVERGDDDHPIWIHICATDPDWGELSVKLPTGRDGWNWSPDGALTPSILCRNCNVHGFWTATGWTPV